MTNLSQNFDNLPTHYELMMSLEENAHKKWWSELSINEQKYYISKHPFFSQMGMDYFYAHKTSLKQVYDNVMDNNLTLDYEVIREMSKTQKFM